VPALAILLRDGRKRVKGFSFWLPAAVVLLICGPWFFLVPGALHERVAKFGGVVFQRGRFWQTIAYLLHELSPIGLAFAVAGIAVVFASKVKLKQDSRPVTSVRDPFWSLAVFLFISTLAFRMMIGAWEPRHLLTLLPFFTLFMGAGIWWFVDIVFSGRP